MKRFIVVVFVIIISSSLAFSQSEKLTSLYDFHNPSGLSKITKSLKSGIPQFQNSKGYPWTVQFTIPLDSFGSSAGAETDGTYIYVTKWNDSIIWKFNLSGTILDTFSIPGVIGLRDLAYDGQYFYGGAAGSVIYKMNFTSKTLVGTINSTLQTVRSICWVAATNSFWVGNWDTDKFVHISSTGTYIDSISAVTLGITGIYGTAYDTITPGGPYLWATNANGLNVEITQIKVSTGLQTGIVIEVDNQIGSAPPGSGGGLFIEPNLITGTTTIGGVLQNDKFYAYDLASAIPDTFDIGVVEMLSPMTNYGLTNSELVTIVVRNHGSSAVSPYGISYTINNGTPVAQTITDTLQALERDTITFITSANLSYLGTYSFDLKTLLASDMDHSNDSFAISVTHLPPINTFPYIQSWENGFDGWINSSNDVLDWTILSGSTPSGNTGPTNAYDGTNYIYTEMSGPTVGDSALIYAPFDFTNMSMPKIKFHYHMYGSTMGTLYMDLFNGSTWTYGVWSKTGDQGNVWKVDSIDLTLYAGLPFLKVQFRSVCGSNWASDIAIDKIEIYQPPMADAGITYISTPTSSGSYNVNVVIKNFDVDTLSSALINWSVNSVIQTPYSWTGSLGQNDTDSIIALIGAFNFTGGQYEIIVWTSNPNGLGDSDNSNDTLSVSTYIAGVVSTFPYCESFENNFGDWVQSSVDSLDWTRRSGGTPTNNTGPSSAYDGSYYLFIETSSPASVGDIAYVDAQFDFSSIAAPVLSFWYNMNGNGMGTLHLDVKNDTVWHNDVWSLSGNQGNTWYLANVPLAQFNGASNIIIRFRGEVGDTASSAGPVYRSDMAIDQICVVGLPAIDVGIIDFISPVSECGLGNESVTVQITNFGADTLNSIPVSYSINNATPIVETFTGTLLSLDTVQFTFTTQASVGNTGSYNFKAFTSLSGDTIKNNDTLVHSITNVYSISEDTIDFENPNTIIDTMIIETNVESKLSIDSIAANTGIYGVYMTGNSNASFITPSGGNEWTINDEYSSRASFCINASSLSYLRLKFDLKQTFSHNRAYSNFRVLINGSQISNTYRPNDETADPFVTEIIDLNSYAGTSFQLTFEARNKYDSAHDGSGGIGDNAFIDNVILYIPPPYDAQVLDITGLESACGLGNEDVSIVINNYGTSAISNLPVSFIVDGGVTILESVSGPINPDDTITYTFTAKANLSIAGTHDIVAFSSLANDADNNNDTAKFSLTTIVPEIPPYTMGFESNEDLSGWGIFNPNNDNKRWTYSTSGQNPNTGVGYAYYPYHSSNNADDWLITTCIELVSGKTYAIKFFYKVRDSLQSEKLELKMGDAQNVTAMTTNVIDLGSIDNKSYELSISTITVPTSGIYYFGWHAYSDADMYNIYIDDFSIDESVSINEYGNNNLNVNIYPVPAKEILNVVSESGKINTLKVFNTMGQCVFNKSVNSSYYQINTSNLAKGVYYIQIETPKGNKTMMFNIVE